MTTYAIGDIQGCWHTLQQLLATLEFSASRDTLWLAGDLVNRGAGSLEVCRWVMSEEGAVRTVLGNHDLTLLAFGTGMIKPYGDHTMGPIFEAPDKDRILDWFRRQPLLIVEQGFVLVHAGLYPWWSVEQAKHLAQEVSMVLRGPEWLSFLKVLFGNTPTVWEESLEGVLRWRFIVNAMGRMRYCTAAGGLNLEDKGPISEQPEGTRPWFEYANPGLGAHQILFGHWAALEGHTGVSNINALDTGCAWGKKLTAMCLENGERFSLDCHPRDRV